MIDGSKTRDGIALALGCVAVLLLMLALPRPAVAAFGIAAFDGETLDSGGGAASQAGSHPFNASTTITFNMAPDSNGFLRPDGGSQKNVFVDLPPGLVGNPTVASRCFEGQLATEKCPVTSQVGVVRLTTGFPGNPASSGLFNMTPRRGVPASFGFLVSGVPVHLNARLRSEGDYGVTIVSRDINQALALQSVTVSLWGVPADSRHDIQRCAVPNNLTLPPECNGDPGNTSSGPNPSGVEPRAFLTLPTACTPVGVGLETRLHADSWDAPGAFAAASFISHETAPNETTQLGPTGCDRVPFDPEMAIDADAVAADAPTGLGFDLVFPEAGLVSTTGLATAHLRRAEVTLPPGMTINPSAADGLQACSDEQLGVGSADPVTCPPASKIGTVTATTPLLEEVLGGDVYVRSQASRDPESGAMFRLGVVIESEERGVRVKLAGRVRADSQTGRLVATFDDNPQLPVSTIRVELKSGPRAPLATPADCGAFTATAALSSWAGQLRDLSAGVAIDCPGADAFSPSFIAGALNPIGGAFSPITARIQRPSGDRFMSGVTLNMPEGLLAALKGVRLCDSLQAEQGGCPAGSRIGTATAGAGAGANPFYVKGDAFLTVGYKGAPYGLAVHVHAKAGPFDLGWVRVRQALYVDPSTAEVSVVSDPLPQVVAGVPIRLRDVTVDVDRPRFAINPTSCQEQQVGARLTSVDGAVHQTSSRFQVANCASLAFTPRLAMRLLGGRQTRTGGHPGLEAILTQAGGQANVAKAKVTLPRSVVLDAKNAYDPKLVCDYDRALQADCPASSIIGRATASTPVLNRPLTGNVHLVQGIKFGPKGNRIRTLPTLLVKLRGEVAIDLRAKTSTSDNSRLVTTFPAVPDAPVSRFSMNIKGGKRGILVVTRTRRAKIDLCAAEQVANVKTDGQNGKQAYFATAIETPCAKRSKRGKRSSSR